jgi:flagellar protein FliO/FliZ
MILAVYGLRKFGGRRFGMAGGGRVIRVVANQYLGGKSQVSVVEVDGERLLLGVSPERVNLLCRLDPSQTSPDFSEELSNLRERPHPQRSEK